MCALLRDTNVEGEVRGHGRWFGRTGVWVGVGLLLAATWGAVEVAWRRAAHVCIPVDVAGDVRSLEAATPSMDGKRLYRARGCAQCHGEDALGGDSIPELGLGHFMAPALARRRSGSTLERYARAVWHGVALDGQPLLLMPAQEYQHLPAGELRSILAFVEGRPPSDVRAAPHAFGVVAKAASLLGWLPLLAATLVDHAPRGRGAPEPGPTVEFGRHLARMMCVNCHGSGMSGGPFPGAPPTLPVPANLTPDVASGLGTWTAQDFRTAMTTGVRPDRRQLNPFMPWKTYVSMTNMELDALWAFLRSLPASPPGHH